MHEWTPEQWGTLITAALGSLAAFVASIIHAFKSQANSDEIKERLGAVETAQLEHERNAAARSRVAVAGRLGPPPVEGGP